MKIAIVIFFIFLHSVSSQLSPAQKSTMTNLFHLLQNQTSSRTWNLRADPCSWAGVSCNATTTRNKAVTELSLSNLGLKDSSFLPLACQIHTLEVLDVSQNLLSSIPDEFFKHCGIIQGLKSVNFSSNKVSGFLPTFGNGFMRLESLDMSHNLLTGNIGSKLSGLAGLKSLNLSFNNFSGLVPTNLGNLMGLEHLQLSTNNFQGAVPKELANYKSLTVLDLSINQLSGNLPSFIEDLPRLEVLVLSANLLSGEVPSFISRLRTLQRFAANQNSFSGLIPPGISRFLKILDLSYNNLGGSLPDDFLSHPNLQAVDLSHNRLEGSIPANVSKSLFRLRLGGNLLNGSILPINFPDLQDLQYLELDNNTLSGTVPPDLGLCQKLQLLNLAENKFSGELPEELGNLTKLTVLSLQRNNFLGQIPKEITLLTSLQTLNISGNSLSGLIPPPLSALKKLQFLHLQGNNLSGSIPREIGDMNSLIELQLGNNYLNGNIASMPSNLQYSLNLSYNHFDGRIPESLSALTSVQILDLSNNRFSGQIPKFLVDSTSLTILLLDNNNLSGEIPKFSDHVKVNIDGNSGLLIPQPNFKPLRQRQISDAIKVAVVVGSVLFGALVAVLAIYVSRRLLYRVEDLEDQPTNEDLPLPLYILSHMLTTNSIHKANIDFKFAMKAVVNPLNLVSKTKFSTYYKVIMPSGQSYLVKKLNCSERIFQPNGREEFREDLESLGKLNSSNIMTPLAYMLAAENVYMFYEGTPKGTLFDALHRSDVPLDWASRCSVAVGLAQGLASLHGCASGPILLFDLTSKTVMLKSLKEPQIGDIELCKVMDPSKSTSSLSAVAGSVGYIPPEYAYTMRVTVAGNIYSFGVILLELLTGRQAVSEGTELAKWVWSNSTQPEKWNRIPDFSRSQTTAAVRSQMLAVSKIALACINPSSEVRPKMKSVLRMLLNVR